ncbi:unnamed protein product [Symbiodinium sp. CCMP2592]|nr:unnamed protein product [Symbiodinium sp. CCMP2592]
MESPGAIWPPRCPDAVFSEASVAALCPAPNTPKRIKSEKMHDRPSPPSVDKASRKVRMRGIKAEPSAEPEEDDPEEEDMLDQLALQHMVQDAAKTVGRRLPARTLSKADKRKAREAQDRSRGLAMCQQGQLAYNSKFQAAHAKHKVPNSAGHWQEFCLALGRDSILKCPACRALRNGLTEGLIESAQQRHRQQQQQPVQDQPEGSQPVEQEHRPVQDQPAEDPVPLVSSGRGRPPSGAQKPTLARWVEQERPGVYLPLAGGQRWYCTKCEREVNAYALCMSAKRHLLKHEQTYAKNHRTIDKPATSCVGVGLGTGVVPSLDQVAESVLQWVEHGCLRTKIAKDPAATCQWAWQDDILFLRHTECSGRGSMEEPCSVCRELAKRSDLRILICTWASKLSLMDYAKVLACGTDLDIAQKRDELVDRDFCSIDAIRKDFEGLLSELPVSQLHQIRQRFECIRRQIRTERLHSWITVNLKTLPMPDEVGKEERHVYQHLCNGFAKSLAEGRMAKEDMQLAAKVASGQLSGKVAVRYLLQSFLEMQSKLDRGLVRVRKTASNETAQELVWMLGCGTGVAELLDKFGVKLPSEPMLRYDSELIPKPLLAFCNKAQLSDNIRVATSLLRCKGTRSAFIALDESYWRPTWEQVVGLVHTDEQQVAVLGGGYHPDPDKNFSLVLGNNLRGLPSAKLARMSVHAVMARTDDRRHTWDVCMVPLLPAAEQGDFSKAEFFVEILGHCMQAYVDTNNLPCMGYALDAGTSNNVARRLALGLQSLEPFEDLPFWKHCCHKNAGLGRYMPISVLHHKPSSTVILASVDNLHLLKRLGAHHVSGTRSIQYGAAVCDLSLALGAGLPPKAYTMHDAMSDKEEAQRTNPACLRSAWCSFGHHGYTLVSSLVALAGEAGDLLTSKERLGAAATCYFFLLMNHMVVKQQHAENAEKYSLPRTTLRNTLHGLLLSILGCMHPGEVGRDSFSARCFQEAVAEHHFGRAKSPYRGTPSFGQGLWGVHRCHVEQLRAKWTAPETGCSPVPSTEVTKVLDDSMEDAAWTLAFMSLGRTASVILADFRAWWPGYGKALVTQGLEEIDDDDDGVDAEGMIFEEEAGEQPADDEDLRLVESLEDHVLNKQQIAQLLDTPPVPEEAAAAASAVVMPSQQAETTEQTEEAETASKHLKAALVLATDASGATSTRPRTWHDLLQRMRTLKDFDLSKPGSELLGACLQRQLLMTPRIRALAASTHHARGILSTAMLSGKEAVCDSDYHKLVHELALARSAGFSDGKRMSRANGWKTVQEKCQAVAMNAAASPWFVHTVTHVRPLTDVEKPQIVLYSYRQGPEVHLGVVTTVFRGAVMKSSSSSRRLRTTKPSTQPLTVSSCAVARVWRCGPTGTTGRQFAVHAASVIDLLDPIGTVIGQIVPATICFTGPEECAIMVLRFNQDQMESIQKVVDSEEAYQEAAAAAPHSVPEPEADTVLNHRSFAHTMQGTTNLVTFMEKLPGLWSARGFQILNDKGGFDLGDGQVVLWTELVQQTPDFFECTCSHVKKDDYGKLIVRKLCDAHPDQGSKGLKTLRDWMREVRKLAQPVLGAQLHMP